MFELLVKITPEQKVFLTSVQAEMEACFGGDQRRIDHALQVASYARELLTCVDADPVLTLSAAYLHDIGIHAAERKHGSSSGRWQEIEGPPIAAEILTGLGAESGFVAAVAEIVGKHHTPGGVDSPEFRILWDADALVNFVGSLLTKTEAQTEAILQQHMVTEPGFQLARKKFLLQQGGAVA